MQIEHRLMKLYQEYRLCFAGEEIVTGCGNPYSPVVLVGEAPGRDEVRLSKPFTGSAGRKLDSFLENAGLDRQSIYITNAIKYRLSKKSPHTGKKINRPAAKRDIENNRPWLLRELDILRPGIIATLGNIPLRTMRNDGRCIGQVHGQPENITIHQNEYLLFPLYHPASLIYNSSLERVFLEDLRRLKAAL